MSALIKQTLSVIQGADGQIAEIIYDGDDERNAIERGEAVRALIFPKTRLSTILLLDDNVRIKLNVNEIPYLLTDRTGVIVIFDETPPANPTLDYFSPPHNAAVYNADGSLRFQLQNPLGEGFLFFGTHTGYAQGYGESEFGVFIIPEDSNEWPYFYPVDGSTADLTHIRPTVKRL